MALREDNFFLSSLSEQTSGGAAAAFRFVAGDDLPESVLAFLPDDATRLLAGAALCAVLMMAAFAPVLAAAGAAAQTRKRARPRKKTWPRIVYFRKSSDSAIARADANKISDEKTADCQEPSQVPLAVNSFIPPYKTDIGKSTLFLKKY